MKPFTALTYGGQMRRMRRLAGAALAAYDLPQARLAALTHGYNTTFRITKPDGGRYVLRIHRPANHTAEAVRSEMQWLAAFVQPA